MVTIQPETSIHALQPERMKCKRTLQNASESNSAAFGHIFGRNAEML